MDKYLFKIDKKTKTRTEVYLNGKCFILLYLHCFNWKLIAIPVFATDYFCIYCKSSNQRGY